MSNRLSSFYQCAGAATWQVVDDEAVVIHTETSEYFGLNLSGTLLWGLLADGARSDDELVEAISLRYPLSEAEARDHVSSFMSRLEQAGLIEQVERAEQPESAVVAQTPTTDPYEPPDLVKFGDLETLILSGE